MLDERIKRASKNKPTKTESSRPHTWVRESHLPAMDDVMENDYQEDDEGEEEEQRIETINDR